MKAYLINMHLLVPRSSAKVKVKYKGYISQKMAVSGTFMFHKHILFSRVFQIWNCAVNGQRWNIILYCLNLFLSGHFDILQYILSKFYTTSVGFIPNLNYVYINPKTEPIRLGQSLLNTGINTIFVSYYKLAKQMFRGVYWNPPVCPSIHQFTKCW